MLVLLVKPAFHRKLHMLVPFVVPQAYCSYIGRLLVKAAIGNRNYEAP